MSKLLAEVDAVSGAELRRLTGEAAHMMEWRRLFTVEEIVAATLAAAKLALELGGLRPEEGERGELLRAISAYVDAHPTAAAVALSLTNLEARLLLDRCDGWHSWMADVAGGLIGKGLGRRLAPQRIVFDTPLAIEVIGILRQAERPAA